MQTAVISHTGTSILCEMMTVSTRSLPRALLCAVVITALLLLFSPKYTVVDEQEPGRESGLEPGRERAIVAGPSLAPRPALSPSAGDDRCAEYRAFEGRVPDMRLDEEGRPFWSWAHVLPFWHSGEEGVLGRPGFQGMDDDALEWLASRGFVTVTLTKSENLNGAPVHRGAERKLNETKNRLKALRPDLPVLTYMNSVMNFPLYDDIHCKAKEATQGVKKQRLYLKNLTPFAKRSCGTSAAEQEQSGDALNVTSRTPIFDWREPEVRRLWREFFEERRRDGFDGAFLDRGDTDFVDLRGLNAVAGNEAGWNDFHHAALRDAQDAWGRTGLVIVNNVAPKLQAPSSLVHAQRKKQWSSFVPPGRASKMAAVYGASGGDIKGVAFEQFLINEFTWYYRKASSQPAKDVLAHMARVAGAGFVVQANAYRSGADYLPDMDLERPKVTWPTRKSRTVTLAGFLVAMCRYSYFGVHGRWGLRKREGGDAWKEAGNLCKCWHEEWNRVLGPPKGDARTIEAAPFSEARPLYFREFEGCERRDTPGCGKASAPTRVYLQLMTDKVLSGQLVEAAACVCFGDGFLQCSEAEFSCESFGAMLAKANPSPIQWEKKLCDPQTSTVPPSLHSTPTVPMMIGDTLRQRGKVLVIALGNHRGGDQSWRSIITHLIDPYSADLATFRNPESSESSLLHRRSRYVWNFREYEDWAEYFDAAAAELGYESSTWRTYLNRASSDDRLHNIFGGMRNPATGDILDGSGAILLAYRVEIRRKIEALGLAKEYDYFVLTRTDQYHLCRHPDLFHGGFNHDTVWVPFGEEYGGFTDRHTIFSASTVLRGLNLFGPFFRKPRPSKFKLVRNIEVLIRRRFKQQELTNVKRFARTFFVAKTEHDSTRWMKMSSSWLHIPALGLTSKYPDEYNAALRACPPIQIDDVKVRAARAELAELQVPQRLEQCALENARPAEHPRHPIGLCYVSDSHRFVLVLTPKCGSSSSRRIATRYGAVERLWNELSEDQRENYLTFGFVRPPIERLESAYGTVIQRIEKKNACSQLYRAVVGEARVASLCNDLSRIDNVDHFVQLLLVAGIHFDEHLEPQVSYLIDTVTGAPLALDLLIDFRHFNRAWELLGVALSFEPPLKRVDHLNQGKGRSSTKSMETNAAVAAARDLYYADFACFDFDAFAH